MSMELLLAVVNENVLAEPALDPRRATAVLLWTDTLPAALAVSVVPAGVMPPTATAALGPMLPAFDNRLMTGELIVLPDACVISPLLETAELVPAVALTCVLPVMLALRFRLPAVPLTAPPVPPLPLVNEIDPPAIAPLMFRSAPFPDVPLGRLAVPPLPPVMEIVAVVPPLIAPIVMAVPFPAGLVAEPVPELPPFGPVIVNVLPTPGTIVPVIVVVVAPEPPAPPVAAALAPPLPPDPATMEVVLPAPPRTPPVIDRLPPVPPEPPSPVVAALPPWPP